MKFVRWFSLILLVLWVIFILVQIVEQFGDSGNYHGTVVDADTGEPIEGASVTVVWDRSVYITIESAAYFHNARETLTGKDGSFSVDAFPGINWSPFGYIREVPHIVIFKPGYGPFPVEQVSPRYVLGTSEKRLLDFPELSALLFKGITVKLRRFKTKEELRRFISPNNMWLAGVPREKIPMIMRLINLQKERIGLQPSPRF